LFDEAKIYRLVIVGDLFSIDWENLPMRDSKITLKMKMGGWRLFGGDGGCGKG